MRILFVDDEEMRHAAFRRAFSEDDRKHVYTVDDAIHALADEVFDLVYLDHDLNDYHLDGMDIVKSMCALPEDLRPKEVVVHSCNVSRALVMVANLTQAGFRVSYQMFSLPVPEGYSP